MLDAAGGSKQGLLMSEGHGPAATLQRGRLLPEGDLRGAFRQPLKLGAADFRMTRLAAAEDQRHLDLVTLLQETLGIAHLERDVVLVGAGAETDAFDLGGLGFLLGLPLLL